MFPGEDEAASKRWNLDVQGSWALWRSLSLYGRLGYSQSEIAPYYRTSVVASTGEWRTRDGVNYGIGLRYGLTRSLGLRLEYARSGLFGTEPGGVVNPFTGQPMPDQSFGEALINLSQAFKDDCRKYISAFVKGRSSTPFTAALKDFIAPIPASIDTCRNIDMLNVATAPGKRSAAVLRPSMTGMAR